jgi:hypothetical protein
MSPSESVDKLLHWVLLNTAVRNKLEAVLGGQIEHSTSPACDSHTSKVARQLCAMNALYRCGLPPNMDVWCTPGTLMEATRELQVYDSAGQVVCSLYVNDYVSSEDSIQAELQLHQIDNMTVYWDERRRHWQIEPQASKRPCLRTTEEVAEGPLRVSSWDSNTMEMRILWFCATVQTHQHLHGYMTQATDYLA